MKTVEEEMRDALFGCGLKGRAGAIKDIRDDNWRVEIIDVTEGCRLDLTRFASHVRYLIVRERDAMLHVKRGILNG